MPQYVVQRERCGACSVRAVVRGGVYAVWCGQCGV